MEKMDKKRKVIKTGVYAAQGKMLAVSVLLTGFFLTAGRIVSANILGDEGNGILTVPQYICESILLLSFFFLPTVLSGTMSLRNAAGQKKSAFALFFCSSVVQTIAGILFSIVCFGGAEWFSVLTTDSEYAVYAFRMLAPVFFLSVFPSVLRGYFQTAGMSGISVMSQVIESALWSGGSIVASWAMVKYGTTAAESGDSLKAASYGAAGAVAGGVLAAVAGCVFLGTAMFLRSKRNPERFYTGHFVEKESIVQTLRCFFVSVCPAFGAVLPTILGRVIKPSLFSHIMAEQGKDQGERLNQLGLYSGRYEICLMFPIVLAAYSAVFVMPVMRFMTASGVRRGACERAGKAVRMASVLLFPSSAVLLTLAAPLSFLLFDDRRTETIFLIRITGISSFFAGMAFASCILLYGMNRTATAVRNAVAAAAADLVVFAVLAYGMKTDLHAIWGSGLTAVVFLCGLNGYELYRMGGIRRADLSFMIRPFLVTIVMGTVAYAGYLAVDLIVGGRLLPGIIPMAAAIVLYWISVWKLKLLKTKKSE